ncbi:MAG: SDR family NAD(P)-dependent oxidoreductase [Cyclobacteriaceae bacterium]
MKKSVIVTGAAGHMGQAVVKQLLASGHSVAGTSLPHETTDELEEYEHFRRYEIDVSDPQAAQSFIEEVANKQGKINFAALLVGGFSMSSLTESSLSDIRKMIHLNFETAFVMAQAVFRQMQKQQDGGHILLVGAKPALEKGASKGLTPYFLSKKLVFALAENINAEGADHSIRASVIVPSVLDTPPNREAMPDADFSKWVSPEQVASVVDFLVSDQASALRDTVIKLYADS